MNFSRIIWNIYLIPYKADGKCSSHRWEKTKLVYILYIGGLLICNWLQCKYIYSNLDLFFLNSFSNKKLKLFILALSGAWYITHSLSYLLIRYRVRIFQINFMDCQLMKDKYLGFIRAIISESHPEQKPLISLQFLPDNYNNFFF